MPIYEYRCQSCNHIFEKMQPFSAGHRQPCPKCGETAERMISLGSFVLKGGGWYVTDHPSKARTDAAKPQPPTCDKKCENCSTATT
ncbi:zinc ribbon domain-containing protein [bacterium]|nr:zinc ribbon domain-containing protein [candidate division CSSED10-310 bacterium]